MPRSTLASGVPLSANLGLVRVAGIPRAQFFNHVVDTDIYIVKWQGKKRRIQAIMDEFTRFEAEARIKREIVQCEIKGFEKLWLGWAGTPMVLRCDMCGAHMSGEFASWCDGHGIKLELIPKAHHKLAIQERNHARASESAVNLRENVSSGLAEEGHRVHVGRSEPSAECERVLSHFSVFWVFSLTFPPPCLMLTTV